MKRNLLFFLLAASLPGQIASPAYSIACSVDWKTKESLKIECDMKDEKRVLLSNTSVIALDVIPTTYSFGSEGTQFKFSFNKSPADVSIIIYRNDVEIQNLIVAKPE